MKYFTKQHEWIDSESYKIGISEFAKNELGEIVYLKLPEIGQHFDEGQELCILESTKAASDVYAPFSGKIKSINPEAIAHINEDPENAGWLVEITPDKAFDSRMFLDHKAYLEMLQA